MRTFQTTLFRNSVYALAFILLFSLTSARHAKTGITAMYLTPYIIETADCDSGASDNCIDIDDSTSPERDSRPMLASHTQAQEPVQLTAIQAFGRSSLPDNFVEINGQLFFTAMDDERTRALALWRSDGTATGTVRILDIPGDLRKLTVIDNVLYFGSAIDDERTVLWRSDGTVDDTIQFAQIPDDYVTSFVRSNDVLFFFSNSGLWKTDETSAGTQLLLAFGPIGLPSDHAYASMNELLYFSANTEEHGTELWQSNGTREGTKLVIDLAAGETSAYPANFTVIDDALYFTAYSDTRGHELWKSDGTAASTTLVKDINEGDQGSNPSSFHHVSGTIYFTANDGIHGHELWRTDGTTAGTSLVRDFWPDAPGSYPKLFRLQDRLYAVVSVDAQQEIWQIRGLTEEPQRTVQLPENVAFWMQATDSYLYFLGQSGTFRSLWQSDGTQAGTVKLIENWLPWEVDPSWWPGLRQIGDTIFWRMKNDHHGVELWQSDLAFQYPVLVKDINPSWDGPYIHRQIAHNDKLYFNMTADEVGASGLWVSDGTPTGTIRLVDHTARIITPSSRETAVIYFAADTALWQSDGTIEGTQRVKDLGPGHFIRHLIMPEDNLYFFTFNAQLWRSDGTMEGTVLVKDLSPLTIIDSAVAAGEQIFFSTYEALWTSDGTAQGTVQLVNIPARQLWPLDNILLFSGQTGGQGIELWHSDGTPRGTALLADIIPGPDSANLRIIGRAGDAIYFTANNDTSGTDLWQSNGTAAGTINVVNLSPTIFLVNIQPVAMISDSIFFAATASTGEHLLIKSDGTSSGTMVLTRNHSGFRMYERPAQDSLGATLNGRVYFAAHDAANGTRLWQSDGTIAGTIPITEIRADLLSLWHPEIRAANGAVYFVGNDGVNGRQFWRYRPHPQNARAFLPIVAADNQ